MLISDVLNSVTAKDLSGSLPNDSNTLYNDRKQGGFTVKPYWQKFNNSDTILLQFVSDANTNITVKTYIPALNETQVISVTGSRTGISPRYYFNVEIELIASYHDKTVFYTVEQSGSNILTSEPFCVSDIAQEVQNGDLKKITYTNLDPNTSSSKNFINWELLDDPMFFYVEGITFYQPSGSVDILETSNSFVNVASKLFRGQLFKTSGVPDYFAEKILKASIMDFFTINNIQYVNPSLENPEQFGGSALFQLEFPVTEVSAVGLNVDDLGIEEVVNPEDMSIVNKKNINAFGTFQIENDEAYMIHAMWFAHNNTSIPSSATIICGTAPGGSDIVNIVMGAVDKSKYVAQSNTFKIITQHLLIANTTAKTLYFTVTGVGADMYVSVNFDTVN